MVKILYLSDRLSLRGGADKHFLQVVDWAVGAGAQVTVAVGRQEAGAEMPPVAAFERIKGLATATESSAGLNGLGGLLAAADLVHVQNVMNPVALAAATATRRAVVTVQDHRVFCPGMGRSLPNGSPCDRTMGDRACADCLPDPGYRRRLLDLTAARKNALTGGRLIVLSTYMAEELAAAGLDGAEVVPPWVAVGGDEPSPGSGFLLGGRLVRHKGVLDAWLGWQSAATAEPLRVAGAGSLAEELEGAELLGWLDADSLRAELGAARALLFPSRWQEPLGILGLEALAVGTPVVVASAGGTAEWDRHGCFRVPQGDVAAMAEAIDRVAGDPELALAMGREGRQMVAEKYARPAIGQRLQGVYETVVG